MGTGVINVNAPEPERFQYRRLQEPRVEPRRDDAERGDRAGDEQRPDLVARAARVGEHGRDGRRRRRAGWKLEGRSIRANVGVEFIGVSWS
eukprot:14481-Pelagococcus_subviridis.AAC.1